ncbi:MAG: hypothetical protein HKN14_11025 [Marinicaulis sp.]|nr:hypothetical protein [Marinicaulis sp.]NNE41434.1 hypothetical protein [Marinicaulis sp.]NNL89243.1 hypothetical protein [Marinicaulis sp.]
MAQSRFEKLQDAIKNYGAASFENLMRCKGFGEAVVAGFPEYIDCGAGCVRAVPPGGQFDATKNYGDEAFSFSHREVIVLEPIQFGIALTVKNFEDSGSMWLRTPIAVEVTGDSFDIFVGKQPMIHVPLEFKDKLEPVFEAIYQEFLSTFTIQVMKFNDQRFETGIGFIPEN